MTREEFDKVRAWMLDVQNRINVARAHLENSNFGLVKEVLAKPYPRIDIKVTEE